MRASEFINEDISQRELNYVEQVADELWGKLGIDIKFTRHFFDRVNDERNGKSITADELIRLFQQEFQKNGIQIANMRRPEAVMKDLLTNINIPFVINNKGDEKELVTKTVMRKKNFMTTTPVYPVSEAQLDEGASSLLYHYAGIISARDIIVDGAFKLSSITGNRSEEQYAPSGYPYFLSTTRSKVGDYHRYVGSGAVMFVLDGDWFGQRYPVKPIDYWERSWLQSGGTRTRESEDRVFSKTSEIPIDGVKAVHVLMKEASEVRSPASRDLLISAKKRGIPAFLYIDENAWRLQDTRRSVSPTQAVSVLGGAQPSQSSRMGRNYLEDILEMIFKKKKTELTPSAEKRVRNLLIYGARHPDEDDGLGVDMSNARKPNSPDYPSAVKINSFMQKNNIKNTVDLKNFLVKKWEDSGFFDNKE